MQHAAHTERTPTSGRRRSPRGKRDAIPGCVRSCAACRARAPRADLLRFVLVDGRVVLDLERKLGGRGVNVGPSPACIERAQKRGAFQRQWKIGLSPEDARVLVAEIAPRLQARWTAWLKDAVRRGALAEVAHAEAIEPALARPLWQRPELAELVVGVPPVSACTPRAAAKMAALAHAASQFTLVGAGDMKRRPEPVDRCPALAPDTGPGGAEGAGEIQGNGQDSLASPSPGSLASSHGRRSRRDERKSPAVGQLTAEGSPWTPLDVEAGVSPAGRPSGGSE